MHVIIVTDECKELGKQARELEKETPDEAIELYRQAANCFAKNDNLKDHKVNLEKVAKLLREIAKSKEDPREAFVQFEEIFSIYVQIDKQTEGVKTMQEAATKFINKAAEIYKAQKNLVLALDNYLQAVAIYRSIDLEEKALQIENRVDEICNMIGIPQDPIVDYLKNQGISSPMEVDSNQSIPDIDLPISELIESDEETVTKTPDILEKDDDIPILPQIIAEQQIATEAIEISEPEVEEKPAPDKVNKEIIPPPVAQVIPEQQTESFSEEGIRTEIDIPSTEEDKSDPITEIHIDDEEKSELIIDPLQKTEESLQQSEDQITPIGVDKTEIVTEISEPLGVTHSDIEKPPETEMKSPENSEEVSKLETSSEGKESTTPEFLDEFDYDNTSRSVIKDRIKSELRGQDRSQPIEEEIKKTADIEDLFDDALDESMEDFLSDFEDVIVVEKQGGKPVITGPIIEILREQGYIKEDLSTEEELLKVPEYQILLMIIKQHPIPLEKIEEQTNLESVSMTISNLQADNLIEQTNDYQWTISEKTKENIREFMSQIDDGTKSDEIDLRASINRNSKYEHLLIVTMFKLGIIPELDVSVMELMQIPEFAAIKTIKDKEPAHLDSIQEAVSGIPPVQVTRMLSKLESQELITRNTDGQWELGDKLVKELVINRQ